MRALKITVVLLLILLVCGLLYLLINAGISLDHARSQNQSLQNKCRQLSLLASDGLNGKSTKDVLAKNNTSSIVKREGSQLYIDNIVLRVENDKIAEVIISDTCN